MSTIRLVGVAVNDGATCRFVDLTAVYLYCPFVVYSSSDTYYNTQNLDFWIFCTPTAIL